MKILIIDDKSLFHSLIGANVELLGFNWQAAHTVDQALLTIKEAEVKQEPFAVVTIDLNFEIEENEMPVGKLILQQIKTKYPHIACIIISGSGLSPHEVLDLRDNYGLDYYISKDRFDASTLERGIKRALERVRPLGDTDKRRQLLQETLEKYQDICVIYVNHLARVEEKKAQRGIDVSVDIEYQIESYKQQLAEAEMKVRAIVDQIKQLEAKKPS